MNIPITINTTRERAGRKGMIRALRVAGSLSVFNNVSMKAYLLLCPYVKVMQFYMMPGFNTNTGSGN
jgi:hypothetical protein